MIKVTKKQRENALYARDVMWPAVAPEQVVEDLSDWRCGTQSCFGGHVAVTPFYQWQGVRAEPYGSPIIPGLGVPPFSELSGYDVADRLFGLEDLFHPSHCMNIDEGFEGTDHELVTHRLNWLIANSEVVE